MDPIKQALAVLRKGAHGDKRDALALVEAQLAAYQEAMFSLLGPGHVPPASAQRIQSKIARPEIDASYWIDRGWHCLRVEERTIGFDRPQAFLNPKTKKPSLRHAPMVERWMTWLGGLCAEFKIAPIQGQIRLAVFPGLAYTFVAWREVQARDTALIHPMDADNVQKPTTDALQTHRGGRTTKESRDLEPEPYGAYINDTQVVDLLVFRLPQEGKAAHDRAEIRKVRVRKIRENRIARARQKEIEAEGSAEPQLSENSISAE